MASSVKCCGINCVSYGKKTRQSYYTISDETLHKRDTVKDWGIIFDTQLVDHINNKINEAYQILGIIKRNFIYLTPHSFLILYKSLERSHLEYGVSVWSPHHEYLVEKLEKVQKRATKIIISIKHLKYEERLRYLKLPTLKFRRVRGDMND